MNKFEKSDLAPQEKSDANKLEAEREKYFENLKKVRASQDLMRQGNYVEGLRALQKTDSHRLLYGGELRHLGVALMARNEIESADAIIKDAAAGNETLRKQYHRSFYESLAYRYEKLNNLKDALKMVMRIEDEEEQQKSLYYVMRSWLAGRAVHLERAEKEARLHEALDPLPFSVVMRVMDICNEFRREMLDEIADLDDMISELENEKGESEQ